MNVKNLNEFFEIELRYAYDCEQKLVEKGLPAMIEAASSPELRSALQQHLQETRTHVARLERVFANCGFEAKTRGNDILDKMLSAGKDSAGHIDASGLRDLALTVNGNIVEHYEIAVYGSLASMARQAGFADAVTVLEETLQEEKAADAKLTQIAQSLSVSSRAASAASPGISRGRGAA